MKGWRQEGRQRGELALEWGCRERRGHRDDTSWNSRGSKGRARVRAESGGQGGGSLAAATSPQCILHLLWQREEGPRPIGPRPISCKNLENENKHHLFPLHHRAKGRQQRQGAPNEMCVEGGLKVDPEDPVLLVLLGGQDVGNKMVPIEEPPMPEDVQDVEDRGAILLNPQGGRAGDAGGRRRRRCQFNSLVRESEDRGGK